MTPTTSRTRAAGRLALLAATVILPPPLLTHLGSLPTSAPTIHDIGRALSHPITPSGWVTATIACLWLCWAAITITVLTELVARGRGRPAARITGMSRLQRWVAETLTAGALLTATHAASAGAVPLHAAMPATVSTTYTTRIIGTGVTPPGEQLPSRRHPARQEPAGGAETPPRADAPTSEMATGQEAAPPVTVVVAVGDNLWDIAQRHLPPFGIRGGKRATEIWDLNRGKTMTDVHGRHQRFNNPNLIRPGWTLTLPPDATNLPTATSTTTSTTATTQPTITPPPPSNGERPAPAVTPADTTSPPHDGDHAVPMPPPPLGVPASPAIAAPPAPHPENADQEPAPDAEGTDGRHAPGDNHLPVGVPVAAGLGLAGGTIALLLARMRRGQSARLRPGRRIRLPQTPLAQIETVLSGGSPTDPLWVEGVLRLAGTRLAHHHSTDHPVQLLGVITNPERAELILSTPIPATAPFTSIGERWSITHDDDTDLLPATGTVCATPLIVSVGSTPDGDDASINLETSPLLTLTGPEENTKELLSALIVGLASAPWADGITIYTDPDIHRLLEPLPHVAELTPDRVADALAVAADALHAATAQGHATVAAARLHHPDGPWAPTVLATTAPLPAELAERAAALARQGAALTIIAPGLPHATTWDVAEPELDLLGHTVTLHHLVSGAGEAVGSLLVDATAPGDVSTADEPYATLHAERTTAAVACNRAGAPTLTARADGADQQQQGDDQPVVPLVRLLGPVELLGAANGPLRPKALEAIVYLASHPAGVTTDQLADALWPTKTPAPKTVYNLIGAARRHLGTATGVTITQTGLRWKLAIDTDITQFRALVDAGKPLDALSLVRGRPYELLIDSPWTIMEGHSADLEGLIVDVAEQAAATALQEDRLDIVEQAAKAGLLACPWHEGLYDLRIQAARTSGDNARVKALIAERNAVLEDELAPFD